MLGDTLGRNSQTARWGLQAVAQRAPTSLSAHKTAVREVEAGQSDTVARMVQRCAVFVLIVCASLALAVAWAGAAVALSPTSAAKQILGSAGMPPATGRYTGSDAAGPVTFKVSAAKHGGAHRRKVFVISDFLFADACAPSGTLVPGKIQINRRNRFDFNAAGITVVGSIDSEFTGNFFGNANPVTVRGKVRVRLADCDSGKLSFTANPVSSTGT